MKLIQNGDYFLAVAEKQCSIADIGRCCTLPLAMPLLLMTFSMLLPIFGSPFTDIARASDQTEALVDPLIEPYTTGVHYYSQSYRTDITSAT